MNEKVIIENIQKQNSDYNNAVQARNQYESLILLSRDVFTEYIRFLFELIQNADDAAATEIRIFILDNHLVISHNGEAFNKEDVEGICNVGGGTKKSNSNATGYKGIGFKSVFGKSTCVSIFSNGFQFKFDETFPQAKYPVMPWQIIPQWTDLPELISGILEGKVWNVSTVIRLDITEDLIADLKELLNTSQILLFLRSVNKISAHGQIEVSIEKKILSSELVELTKNNSEKHNWIVRNIQDRVDETIKTRIVHDQSIPDKIKFASTYDISFAAKVEKGKIIALNESESLIFTFLPTKVKNFGFPFLLNSNFLADTSREKLHEDNAWNKWLMEIAGKQIVDWLAELSTSEFALQILHLLPEQSKSTANKLTESFFETFHCYSQGKPFVPNKGNILKTPNEIVIDETGLSNEEFVNNGIFISYINSHNKTSLPFDALVNPKLQSIGKLRKLKSTFFNIEDLIDFFTSEIFKLNHKPEQNHLLIKYFYRDSEKKSNEWFEKLKYIPFIYAKGIGLMAPNRVCFPSQSELTDLEREIKVIHEKAYDKIVTEQPIIEWLKRLGVSEVSEIKWLEKEIIPKLNDLNYEKDFLGVTSTIFKLHKNGLLEKWHYSELNRLKLLCINGIFIEANKCYLSDYYLPELSLEETYKNGYYVSERYCLKTKLNKTEFKHFLSCIKVSEDVTLVTHEEDLYWGSAGDSYYRKFVDKEYDNGSSNWSYHTGCFSQSHAFRRFKEFSLLIFTKNSFVFAKLFWNFIIQKYAESSEVFEDVVLLHGWSRDYHTYVKNYNKWFIENEKCIPCSTGELNKSSTVFSNEKEIKTICGRDLPVIDVDKPINSFWLEVLCLRTEIEIFEYLKILKIISNEKELLKSNIKRIELIYSHILKKIPTLTLNEKNIISQWAISHKLFCDNGRFENVNEIIWVNNKDFVNKSEHLKILFISEKFEINSSDFTELLNLFRIQIIDKFFVELKDKLKDYSLRRQLLVILPYFSTILERKQFKVYSDEFKRLSNIIDHTEFYNASEIVLSFKNQNEIILGPSLYAYLDESELSFNGKWSNPITLYALLPEITKLFDLTGTNEELSLLLQLEERDIEEWFASQGYDAKKIKDTQEFKISRKIIEGIVAKEGVQNVEIISIGSISKFNHIEDILKRKNITLEQLEFLIENYDSQYEEIGGNGSSSDIAKLRQNEDNEEARKLVMQKLTKEKYMFTQGIGSNSVVNGVYKNDMEFPLVVKSYRNSSWKFNINPNEWIQLSKPNAMFWVHRGGGHLEFLELKGLLRANSEFFVRFETDTFTLDDLVNFASVFRFVRNVHFQLDAPNFSAAKAFDDYRFYERNIAINQEGGDDIKIIE